MPRLLMLATVKKEKRVLDLYSKLHTRGFIKN